MNAREINNQAKDEVKEAVRLASPWLVRLGRFGFAAKGVVFVLVGVLAAVAAIGAGAANDGTPNAASNDIFRNLWELFLPYQPFRAPPAFRG